MKIKSGFLMIIALFVIIGFVTEQAYSQERDPNVCQYCKKNPCVCRTANLVEIDLRSEIAGTVLLNGSGSGFFQMVGNNTITANNNILINTNSAIKLLVRSGSGTEYTFSVRDSEGIIYNAVNVIKTTGNTGSYQVTIRRSQPAQTNVAPQTQTQVIQSQVPPENTFEVEQLANNTLAITNYNGNIRDIIIPENLYGLKVTIISNLNGYNIGDGNLAVLGNNRNWDMMRNKRLRSIVFPNSIIRIGEAEFTEHLLMENVMPAPPIDDRPVLNRSGNTSNTQSTPVDIIDGLHQVIFGNSVRIIGNYTFYENPSLKEIVFPNSLVDIGIRAFMKCSLTRIILPSGIKRIGQGAFARNKIQSVIIPVGVELIGSGAFSYNEIQTVSIPAGIQNVGSDVFYNNPITRATLPANLSNDVMQRWGFETNLINYYTGQNRVAGTYVKNGPIWTRQ